VSSFIFCSLAVEMLLSFRCVTHLYILIIIELKKRLENFKSPFFSVNWVEAFIRHYCITKNLLLSPSILYI